MAEIINDLTIQIFKDVLLNNLYTNDNENMLKIANDYGISGDDCVAVLPTIVAASNIINRGGVIASVETMKQLDEDSAKQMIDNNVSSITIGLDEYGKLIDTLGIEKVASVFGDSVMFYEWYRKSNDNDLAILKDRDENSEDIVIDDENPFMA